MDQEVNDLDKDIQYMIEHYDAIHVAEPTYWDKA